MLRLGQRRLILFPGPVQRFLLFHRRRFFFGLLHRWTRFRGLLCADSRLFLRRDRGSQMRFLIPLFLFGRLKRRLFLPPSFVARPHEAYRLDFRR